jgi:hypothetical protein
MAGDATQVAGGHNMIVYQAAYASALALPLDTVVYGGAWPAGWADMGYTQQGLHARFTVNRTNVQVDQSPDPVLRIAQGRDMRMNTRLGQLNGANVFNSLGQGTFTASTGAGVADRIVITPTISDIWVAMGFDIQQPATAAVDNFIRLAGWRGLAQGDAPLDFNADALDTVGIEYGLVPDTANSRLAEFRFGK